MNLGGVFDEVPELYDRVRPGYPDELFADLAGLAGISDVLEVGCGTGQATRSLLRRGWTVTAVEPGPGLAALGRTRVPSVTVEEATFEEWDDRGRRFDAIVAASSWHWVDPATGWRKAHDLLRPGGVFAVLEHVVVRRPGEPEVYAETADLHERWSPGNPDWGHPPLEEQARAAQTEWSELFDGPLVLWYPTVQWLDAQGFTDLLRTQSPYRRLAPQVREPLLTAIAERIRDRMGDRAPRRFLDVLRAGRRVG